MGKPGPPHFTIFPAPVPFGQECIGTKAQNLLRLDRNRLFFHVPKGFVLDAKLTGAPFAEIPPIEVLLEKASKFGPRLVVRSSPVTSMPGLLETVVDVPNGDAEALQQALRTVIGSWNAPAAVEFRRLYRIPQDYAMGVIIQEYIAPGPSTWAGVYFTRNPHNGDAQGIIEALAGTAGKELVGGQQTPTTALPAELAEDLRQVGRYLEGNFGYPLDIEFVIEGEKLYLVQARKLRHLTAPAAALIAADMQREGTLTAEQAQALLTRRDNKAPWWLSVVTQAQPLVKGMGAVSGAVSGRISFGPNPTTVGPDVIYTANFTNAEETTDMLACGGILTNTGGQTCHAAILAMQGGIPAVVGAPFAIMREHPAGPHLLLRDGTRLPEGTWITIDGTTGEVYRGQQLIVDRRVDGVTSNQ